MAQKHRSNTEEKIYKNKNNPSPENYGAGEETEEEEYTHYNFTAEDDDEGKRTDVFIPEKISGISRSYVQKLIDRELLLINGKKEKGSYKLKDGDEVEFIMPPSEDIEAKPENIPIKVVYEDSHLAVVEKPEGMVVHPAPGNPSGTLVNALLYKLGSLSSINGVKRPGIVHRIDKDTSGLLVVAKDDLAHRALSDQLREHTITRVYYALCEGRFKETKGTIEGYLARDPKNRLRYSLQKEGRFSVSHYEVLVQYKDCALLKVMLETGRTHQIRVHMASVNHPLLLDPLYGKKSTKGYGKEDVTGQLLHAGVLGFIHPVTGKYMEFKKSVPEGFKNILIKKNRELKG